MDPQLPAHLSDLSEAIDIAAGERFRSTNSFAEALLKSVTALLYSDVAARDRRPAIDLASGIGAIGTWYQLLTKLTAQPHSVRPQSMNELSQWLRAQRMGEPWFQDARLAVAQVLAALDEQFEPRELRSCIHLLGVVVRIRNKWSHAGNASFGDSTNLYAATLRTFALQCPCFYWPWIAVSGDSTSAQSADGRSVAGWFVHAPDETVEIVDLATADPDAHCFWFLNECARDGRSEFIDYATNSHRDIDVPFRGCGYGLSRGAAPKPEPKPLPHPLTRFVGRDREVRDALQLLKDRSRRLLTIHGFGGAGKSRMALELAERMSADFAGHRAFIELDAMGAAEDAPRRIAEEFRVSGGDLAEGIARVLNEPWLLVLDNFEHVRPATHFVVQLLERIPTLRILVTSRVPLGVNGESHLHLEGLDFPDSDDTHPDEATMFPAVAFLIDRIKDVSTEFRATAEVVPHIVSITRQMRGSPLALELIAPRMVSRTPAEIAAQIDTVVRAAVGKGPPRQRTVEATIQWSFQFLSDRDRIMVRRVAGLLEPYPIAAAATVCDLDELGEDAVQSLESLRDQGWIEIDATHHLRLHPLIREFAKRLLVEANELAIIESRLLRRWFELITDHDDGDWADIDSVEQAYLAIGVELFVRNAKSDPDSALAVLISATRRDFSQSEYERALERMNRILPECKNAKDSPSIAEAHNLAVIASSATSDPDWSAHVEAAVAVFRRSHGPRSALGWLDTWMAEPSLSADYDETISLLDLRLKLARAAHDSTEIGQSRLKLCEARLELYDVGLSAAALGEALRDATAAARLLPAVDPDASVRARVYEMVVMYHLRRPFVKRLAKLTRATLERSGLERTKRLYDDLMTRAFVRDAVENSESATILANMVRLRIEQSHKRIKDQDSDAGLVIRLQQPDGTMGPAHLRLFWSIARLFGVLDSLAERTPSGEMRAIVNGLASIRWESEERMGVDQFRGMSLVGATADPALVSLVVGPPLPGDDEIWP